MWLPLDANTHFAIINSAKQAGADLKVVDSATGYGQALLDDPTAAQTAQAVYFPPVGQPVEANTPATSKSWGHPRQGGAHSRGGGNCRPVSGNADRPGRLDYGVGTHRWDSSSPSPRDGPSRADTVVTWKCAS